MSILEEKERIETVLSERNLEAAIKLITQYENRNPHDIDIISLKLNYFLMVGDMETAADLALQGVRRLPLNGDMQYNLAYIYEMTEQWVEAYICYQKAEYIYRHTKDEKAELLNLDKKSSEMLEKYEETIQSAVDKTELAEKQEELNGIINMSRNRFGLLEAAFRSCEQIVGKFFYENRVEKRFAGVFKDQYLSKGDDKEANMDVIHLKTEFLKVHEGQQIHVADPSEQEDTEYLLPIACSEERTGHYFQMDGKEYPVIQYAANHFNYYRVKNNTTVLSTRESYYGNPIPLRSKEGKKKLVLSIFVDGLSQHVLKGENFQKNMPYTYEYFKNGMICDRAYNTAEWTYPSIANYVTGLDTTHHMLFHNELDGAMPLDVPTLAEYFHNDGYYTAKLCGNWRIIPSYGHARGYDRFVYQHQWVGFKVQEVIGDAINHLEAFKDVNQYLWISIGDLHDIADAVDLPVEVQRDLPLELRTYEDKGSTSAKQSFSQNKTMAYIRDVKHVDRWLHILYSYLEENFPEDDIIVSLFSDHGQGYLIERDAHFLSKERSNVAFMFRGGEAEGKGIVNEIISASDYSSIMRRLAEVKLPEVPTDGRLPEILGGTKARDYALTESIHPKDPYQAAIFSKEETFFFVNSSPVEDDGRFRLADYEYWLEDTQGTRIENAELSKKYLDIMLQHIAPILIYE